MIKIPQSKNWQEDTALRRYQMIAPLLDESLDDAKRIQLREEVARKYEISTRSLYRYEAAYKAEGFSGLKPVNCFLQALFPQKCRLTSSKLHGEFPQYCISSAGTLSGAGEEPLQAYKVY